MFDSSSQLEAPSGRHQTDFGGPSQAIHSHWPGGAVCPRRLHLRWGSLVPGAVHSRRGHLWQGCQVRKDGRQENSGNQNDQEKGNVCGCSERGSPSQTPVATAARQTLTFLRQLWSCGRANLSKCTSSGSSPVQAEKPGPGQMQYCPVAQTLYRSWVHLPGI